MLRAPFHLRLDAVLGQQAGDIADVAGAISVAVFGPERPAPRNLDGLADLLREARPARVVACDWHLPADETRKVAAIFRDNRVELVR